MSVPTTFDLMAQFARHLSELRKRDLKELIEWFIGCHSNVQGPIGQIRLKANDLQASYREVKEFLQGSLARYAGRKIILPRRTLYRYIEELKKGGFVEQPRQGVYKLTETGLKRWSFINVLFKASNTISAEEPIGTFFSFGPKEEGLVKYIDIVIRVQDPDQIKTIEKAIVKNEVPENDKELGKLLSMVIMWRFMGVFSRIGSLIEGKEDAFAELLDRLPISKDDAKPNSRSPSSASL